MDFSRIFAALNEAGARYIVVGGVATVLHGYLRLTVDLDLIVDFEPASLRKTLDALKALGLTPSAPVDLYDFVDSQKRIQWARDKNMRVFSLSNPDNPLMIVDIFVEHPLNFQQMYDRSEIKKVKELNVRIACIDDLIALKRLAGREQDLQDIKALGTIKGKNESA